MGSNMSRAITAPRPAVFGLLLISQVLQLWRITKAMYTLGWASTLLIEGIGQLTLKVEILNAPRWLPHPHMLAVIWIDLSGSGPMHIFRLEAFPGAMILEVQRGTWRKMIREISKNILERNLRLVDVPHPMLLALYEEIVAWHIKSWRPIQDYPTNLAMEVLSQLALLALLGQIDLHIMPIDLRLRVEFAIFSEEERRRRFVQLQQR